MTSVHFIDTNFEIAPALVDLTIRRRVAATRASMDEDGMGADTLVMSAAHETKLGGQSGAVDAARKIGAKRIVVVTPDADCFSITEDLGGRLQRISLPAVTGPALTDGGMMLLTDAIASPLTAMVAADPKTGALLDMASRVAKFDVSVFINGPTGSGKEVLARQIHLRSHRADKPFVAINCAAIPENMLEAILFGHEKGAFTGASTPNKGIVRAADGGTLMLDEISEMPLGLQSKLLRVLQEKVVTPLGSQTELPVDIRIVATSNRDMDAEIEKGTFREDLYYRLNVFPLDTIALAERPDDITVLAQSMLRRHARKDQAVPLLTPEACAVLTQHSWPGNVRELENVMQRALVLQDDGFVRPDHIMITMRSGVLLPAQAA